VGRGLGQHAYGAGQEQTFKKDPDGGGNEVGGIYVRDSVPTVAYWVQPDFWAVWQAQAGAPGPLGYPTGNKVSPCPAGAPSDCTAYQQFEGGFIYAGAGGAVLSVTADLYAVSSDGIKPDHYRRLTPGGSWTVKAGTPLSKARTLKYFGNGLLFHTLDTTGAQVPRSTDAGETWTALPTPDSALKPVDIDRSPDGRVWSLWQGAGFARVYYSDSNGDSWTQSTQISSTNMFAGSIAASASDSNRVAVAWVLGSTSLRATVTTNRGAAWTTYSPGGNGGIMPQVIWSGSRLVLAADNLSTFRLLLSTNDGMTWTQQQTYTTGGTSTTTLGLVRGSDTGVLFAFSSDVTSSTRVIARSNDQGTSWTNVGALPSGTLITLRAIAYDAQADTLYAAWQKDSRVTRLRQASTRDWAAVAASDWEEMAQIGEATAPRGLVAMYDR